MHYDSALTVRQPLGRPCLCRRLPCSCTNVKRFRPRSITLIICNFEARKLASTSHVSSPSRTSGCQVWSPVKSTHVAAYKPRWSRNVFTLCHPTAAKKFQIKLWLSTAGIHCAPCNPEPLTVGTSLASFRGRGSTPV